jgi:hypothetical protein
MFDLDAPPLFRSDSPTITFSKLPEGKIKLRSNSIDGEKVVPAGGALLVTLAPGDRSGCSELVAPGNAAAPMSGVDTVNGRKVGIASRAQAALSGIPEA